MKIKKKVLLVADDAGLVASLEKEFEKLHFQLLLPGESVMHKVFDELPHLVLVDENYGGGEGRSIARQIKEDLVLKYIPVILLVNEKTGAYPKDSEAIDFYVQKNGGLESVLFFAKKAVFEGSNELDLNPLTHLPGARTSVLHLEEAIRSKKPFAVLCLDLSDLAAFNALYGDARGDEVIIFLAQTVKEAVRQKGHAGDFVGHLGGDDLWVLTHLDCAVAVAEAIIGHFDARIPTFYNDEDRTKGHLVRSREDGQAVRIPLMSVLIGILHNDNHLLTGMDQMSRIAGELKKCMKTMPGSSYIQYQCRSRKGLVEQNGVMGEARYPSMRRSVHLSGIQEGSNPYAAFLHSLLKSKKIKTVYQPLVDFKAKKIVGYEALTRGVSGTPLDEVTLLFGVARSLGKVKELDRLCVECALKSAQSLRPDQKLFLNLDPQTLADNSMMANIFAARGVIEFKSLVVEITEQSILGSFDRIREAVRQLKRQGIAVAIDDVGGGAVSLRDVAILRPDYIKFDRSLIRQIGQNTTKQQIILSMILFAGGIQAMTTAEGIETRAEYEAARMCGVDLGQGYYLARPGDPFPELKKYPQWVGSGDRLGKRKSG